MLPELMRRRALEVRYVAPDDAPAYLPHTDAANLFFDVDAGFIARHNQAPPRASPWAGEDQSPPPCGAVLTARPNPVPAAGELGVTVIEWSTGDGSVGQVYVSLNGGAETLFAEGAAGSEYAPWIGGGAIYEFRLYKKGAARTPLAVVKVIRAR